MVTSSSESEFVDTLAASGSSIYVVGLTLVTSFVCVYQLVDMFVFVILYLVCVVFVCCVMW